MLSKEDYEKLARPENLPLQALVKLSQLRRRVSESGYRFDHIKTGEAILLLEAARVIDCEETRSLARQLLQTVGAYDSDLRPPD